MNKNKKIAIWIMINCYIYLICNLPEKRVNIVRKLNSKIINENPLIRDHGNNQLELS